MKLNEAIMLFESFGDLKRFIDQYFISIFGTTEPSTREWVGIKDEQPVLYRNANDLATMKTRLRQYIPDFPNANPITAKKMLEVIRFIVKDDRMKREDRWRGTGHWIKAFRQASTSQTGTTHPQYLIFALLHQIYSDTITHHVENPPKQKPQIKEITKTQHYHIFELENFEAAEKVKNTFNVRWCIGVNAGWFHRYGEQEGRKTYVASLPNKTVFAIHAGRSTLITTHDNEADVDQNGRGRGDEMRGIIEQMRDAGFNDELIPDIIISMLKKVNAPYTRAFVQEMERVMKGNTDVLSEIGINIESPSEDPNDDRIRIEIVDMSKWLSSSIVLGIDGDRNVIQPRTKTILHRAGSVSVDLIRSIMEQLMEEMMIDDISTQDLRRLADMIKEKILSFMRTRRQDEEHRLPKEYYLMFDQLNRWG